MTKEMDPDHVSEYCVFPAIVSASPAFAVLGGAFNSGLEMKHPKCSTKCLKEALTKSFDAKWVRTLEEWLNIVPCAIVVPCLNWICFNSDFNYAIARGIIITTLDEVVWLYNVHGGDVSYSPVVHSFAVVTTSSAFFYVDERKLSSKVKSYLKENNIPQSIHDPISLSPTVSASRKRQKTNLPLSLPTLSFPYLGSGIQTPKPNPVEMEGLKKCTYQRWCSCCAILGLA